jgi:rRNA maturation protein Nop10
MSRRRTQHEVVSDGEVRDFKQCLLCARCAQCGSKLKWEADPEADDPNTDVPYYSTECCGVMYSMVAHTAKISVDDTYKKYLENLNKPKSSRGRTKSKKTKSKKV